MCGFRNWKEPGAVFSRAGIIAFRQRLKDSGRARGMHEIRREMANLQQQYQPHLTESEIQRLQVSGVCVSSGALNIASPESAVRCITDLIRLVVMETKLVDAFPRFTKNYTCARYRVKRPDFILSIAQYWYYTPNTGEDPGFCWPHLTSGGLHINFTGAAQSLPAENYDQADLTGRAPLGSAPEALPREEAPQSAGSGRWARADAAEATRPPPGGERGAPSRLQPHQQCQLGGSRVSDHAAS